MEFNRKNLVERNKYKFGIKKNLSQVFIHSFNYINCKNYIYNNICFILIKNIIINSHYLQKI